MNHFCLRFTKLQSADGNAAYRVESFDFTEYDCWEEVARLRVSLRERDYTFEPGERWTRERILPPKFYALSEERQAKEFREVWAPLRMGLGAYALRVHQFATFCIEQDALPEGYPVACFREASGQRVPQRDSSQGAIYTKRRDLLPTFGRDRFPVLEAGVLRAFADRVHSVSLSTSQGAMLGEPVRARC